jgi:hypothetical protein
MEKLGAPNLPLTVDTSQLEAGTNFQYLLEQSLGIGLPSRTAIEWARNPDVIRLPNIETPLDDPILPLGVPDGDKPPPLALPLDILGDDILAGIQHASRNAVVIQYRSPPYFKGTGFFIGPDTILTAAHVADFFLQGLMPTIWVHQNNGFGQATKRTFVKSAHVLNSWVPGLGRSETDIGILRLAFHNNKFSPISCATLDKRGAKKTGVETPYLEVKDKVGGPLKLLSFFDQNPQSGLAKDGVQITTGSYIDPKPRTAIPNHVLGGHNIRSYKAWSGSAVLQTDKTNPKQQVVVGVHVHGAEGINLFAGFSKQLVGSLNAIAGGEDPSSKIWSLVWKDKP